MKNNYQQSLLSKANKKLDREFIDYIYPDYSFFDKEQWLLRYDNDRMEFLCSENYSEYFVSPFQEIFIWQKNKEYIYTTFNRDKQPIETCGICLTEVQQKQLIPVMVNQTE
ncbi:hypothetical protein [Enterococcus mundtii]|uniref:hypothetical protein n=1 Tax=Enterococcus mundtii TaxID=53346 RepID=UPI0013775272|nr:hypothetical protein [Enterococcus mundtii]NBA63205.1 hypothetical protein [Enterococcus mundtii]